MTAPALTRRAFAKGTLGLTIAFALAPRLALGAAANALPGSLAQNPMLDAWLGVNADGTVTVMTGKVELGQGVLTALAQIAAEELGLPLARVRMISGDTGATPDEGFTSGSQSIEYGGTAVRLAAAEVRAILIDKAAQRLGVAAEGLTVADGVIKAADGSSLGYGELAADGMLHREASATAKPTPPAEHKLVGKPIPRLDIPAKVTGGAAYVQDMRLPGMLHGRVVRPPRYGATQPSRHSTRTRCARCPGSWPSCATAVSSASSPSARSRQLARARPSPRRQAGKVGRRCPRRAASTPTCARSPTRTRS
ncbi:MAG: molybdopterin cofactor-binding domain-containing protein [Alphaproteobacteria bacterium]